MTNKTKDKNVTAKPKNLTMAKVKREAVAVNKMEAYELNDNDQIRHYPIFPQGKINEMLQEYQEKIEYATEKGIMLPDDQVLDYIYFLCIKHFTSLKKGVSDKYEDQLLQMKHLVDSGYFKQIVNEVFSQEEIHKVLDTITDVMSSFQLLEDAIAQVDQKTEKLKGKGMMNVLADEPNSNAAD